MVYGLEIKFMGNTLIFRTDLVDDQSVAHLPDPLLVVVVAHTQDRILVAYFDLLTSVVSVQFGPVNSR